jgi:hypothetical protein
MNKNKNTGQCLAYIAYGKCQNLNCKFEHEEDKSEVVYAPWMKKPEPKVKETPAPVVKKINI